MSNAWYIFKTHAHNFERYLKFLVNLKSKICTIVKTGYYYFSNYLKNGKECWKLWARIFRPSTIYLQKMRYIRWFLFDLKLIKSLICSHKRPGFPVIINVSVKKHDFQFFLFYYYIGYELNYSYMFFISMESVEKIGLY